MSEIRIWLDGIGLAQYANVFETNDTDINLLGQVDDQVLKDIGISSAGSSAAHSECDIEVDAQGAQQPQPSWKKPKH